MSPPHKPPAAAAGPQDRPLVLSARGLRALLYFGVPALAVLSVAMSGVKNHSRNGIITEIADRFILNNEASLPTLLSSLLMMTAAALAAVIFLASRRAPDTRLNGYWLLISLIFAVLAYDEIAQVHERLRAPVAGGLLREHSWIAVGLPLVLLLAAGFAPFLRALPRALAGRMLLAAALFLSGALAAEAAGGLYALWHDKDAIYGLITVLEESLELAGVCYFAIALLEHAAQLRITLQFSGGSGSRP